MIDEFVAARRSEGDAQPWPNVAKRTISPPVPDVEESRRVPLSRESLGLLFRCAANVIRRPTRETLLKVGRSIIHFSSLGGSAAAFAAAAAAGLSTARTSPCRFFDANCELTYSFAAQDRPNPVAGLAGLGSPSRSTYSMYAMAAESLLRWPICNTRVNPPGRSLYLSASSVKSLLTIASVRTTAAALRRAQAALLGEGDDSIGDAAELLRLRDGGLDALVLDELRDHGAHHGPPVAGILAELAEVSAVLHPAPFARGPVLRKPKSRRGVEPHFVCHSTRT